VKIIDV